MVLTRDSSYRARLSSISLKAQQSGLGAWLEAVGWPLWKLIGTFQRRRWIKIHKERVTVKKITDLCQAYVFVVEAVGNV